MPNKKRQNDNELWLSALDSNINHYYHHINNIDTSDNEGFTMLGGSATPDSLRWANSISGYSNKKRNELDIVQIKELIEEAISDAKKEINRKIESTIDSAVQEFLEKDRKNKNSNIKKFIVSTIQQDIQKKVETTIETDVEKPEADSFMKSNLKRAMNEEIAREFSKMREENTTKIFTILGAVIGILSFIFISVNVVTQVDTLRSALILILAMAFLLMSFIFAMNLILVDKESKEWRWWFKFAFMIVLVGMILFGAFYVKGGLNEKSQKNQLDNMKKELEEYDEKLKISNDAIKALNENNENQTKILDCIKNKGYFSVQCYQN